MIVAGLMAAAALGADTTSRKPNMVIIFIDDLGVGDLGYAGNKWIPTPNIDTLAREGVSLSMSYITNPPCCPSRASLMTGMYAQRFGKFGMSRGMPIPEDHPTLAEFMRDAGYVTGQVGKWDLGGAGQGPHQRGFMEVARWAPDSNKKHADYDCRKPDGSMIYRTDLDGDYMVEFVERNKDKPFFLYWSPLAIHLPLGKTPQEYIARLKGKVKGGKKYHGGAIVAVDEQVGRLLTVLKKHELDKNTLILFTGDNGPSPNGSSAPYRGGKAGGTQQEGWVHTPGLAWWPGTLPAGKVFDGITCTLDYYATAAAIAGKDLPERCDGKNLIPYLTGEKTGDVHEAICWYNADPKDAARRRLSAVRWKNWRLHMDQATKAWRLFDLKNDPQEKENVSAQNEDVVEKMKLMHKEFVADLPSIDSIPKYSNAWAKPPEGWGWEIGEGK